MKRAAFVAILLVSAGSLLFDLLLPWRLPSDADWAEAAAAIRAQPGAAQAVQLWPAWAERARRFVGADISTEEDLAAADFAGVQRLWLLSLPRVPFARVGRAQAQLRARGATPVSSERRFGALALELWDLHADAVVSDLTHAAGVHEVDYQPRACVPVAIGGQLEASGAGSVLHLRAGVIGERAYDANRPPVAVRVWADREPIGTLEVPRTTRDGTGWRKLDVPLQGGDRERAFVFAVSSPDSGRPFCVQAWTTNSGVSR